MSGLKIEPSTWLQLSKLLDTALEQPAAARSAWIDSLGPELAALKPQLRDLLSRAAQVQTRDFLETLPRIDVRGGHDGASSSGTGGEQVGAYRLVREIGVGGMGTVWLAERADGLFTRPLALKLPHLLGPRGGLAERMAREREILASLDHPNIARLFDAGLAANGQPFLALEYVEGVPIDQYVSGGIDGARLQMATTLRLFIQVVNAVAYAHGRLVIHRDLKPANIMVNGAGDVRLLDFGVAKLLEDGQTRATRLTQINGLAMTPDYASPEQILGEPLGVASDIYSLGVILFELLSGQRPYRLKRDSRGALEDAIVQAQPTQLPPECNGDLETIVRKALKKRPGERYATAVSLADDITRFLERRPVLARPDSRWYRMTRFMARNRFGVSAAALVTLALLAVAGAAVWQARTAIAERSRAEEVTRFISAIFVNADPYQNGSGQLSGVALLRAAQGRIATEFADRPLLKIELLTLVGVSLKNLGDLQNAEGALRDAIAVSTQLLGERHLATVRARTQLADIYNVRRDITRLDGELRELLPLARAVAAQDEVPLVMLLIYRTDLDFESGRYDDCQLHAREAYELAYRVLGSKDNLTVRASNLLSESYLVGPGNDQEMLADVDRGLALAVSVFGTSSQHPLLLQMRTLHARALGVAGNFHEAIAELAPTVEILKTVLGGDDTGTANALFSVASWERRIGDLSSAIRHSREGLAVLDRHIVKESADYSVGLTGLGTTLIAARQPAEAAVVLADAEAKYEKLFGEAHWDALSARFNLAWACAYLGQHERARKLLEIGNRAGIDIEYPMWFEYLTGATRRLAGDASGAARRQQKALALIGDGPKASWDRIRVNAELGLAELDLGNFDAAFAALTQMRALADQNRMQVQPVYAEALVGLGRVHLSRGESVEALQLLKRADTFWRGFDPENPGAGEALYWLAKAQLAEGQRVAARSLFSQAAGVLQRSPLVSAQRLAASARAAALAN